MRRAHIGKGMIRIAIFFWPLLLTLSYPAGSQTLDTAVPDFQDGSWQVIHEEDARVQITQSPAEMFIFTIGKARQYRKSDDPDYHGMEGTGIDAPQRTIYKSWWRESDIRTKRYAIRINADVWHIGTRLHTNVDLAGHRMRHATMTVYGGTAASATITIANPYLKRPTPQTPQQPALPPRPAPSSGQRKL